MDRALAVAATQDDEVRAVLTQRLRARLTSKPAAHRPGPFKHWGGLYIADIARRSASEPWSVQHVNQGVDLGCPAAAGLPPVFSPLPLSSQTAEAGLDVGAVVAVLFVTAPALGQSIEQFRSEAPP